MAIETPPLPVEGSSESSPSDTSPAPTLTVSAPLPWRERVDRAYQKTSSAPIPEITAPRASLPAAATPAKRAASSMQGATQSPLRAPTKTVDGLRVSKRPRTTLQAARESAQPGEVSSFEQLGMLPSSAVVPTRNSLAGDRPQDHKRAAPTASQPSSVLGGSWPASSARSHPGIPHGHVKTEPRAEPTAASVTEEKCRSIIDMVEFFQAKHSIFPERIWCQLRNVQTSIVDFVTSSSPPETFDMLASIPTTIQLSPDSRVLLCDAETEINRLRTERLVGGRTVRDHGYTDVCIDHPIAPQTAFNTAYEPGPAGLQRPGRATRPSPVYEPYQGRPSRAESPESYTMRADSAGWNGYNSLVDENDGHAYLQAPAARLNDTAPSNVPFYPSPGRAAVRQTQSTHSYMPASEPRAAPHGTRSHAALTVLTLPRLGITQSPQTLAVAHTILQEANNLLHWHSNVQLAFSAQDARRD